MVTVAKRKRTLTGFGSRLRTLRESAGLTQTVLAERAGLLYQTVAKYERGEVEPNWANVLKLADALRVGTEAFRDASGQIDSDEPPAAGPSALADDPDADPSGDAPPAASPSRLTGKRK